MSRHDRRLEAARGGWASAGSTGSSPGRRCASAPRRPRMVAEALHVPARAAAERLRIPARSDVLFGEGAIEALPGLARGLGAEAAFVISGPGLVAVGVTPRALSLLRRAGLRSGLFDAVGVN